MDDTIFVFVASNDVISIGELGDGGNWWFVFKFVRDLGRKLWWGVFGRIFVVLLHMMPADVEFIWAVGGS